MRPGGGSQKGSQFEREICRKLSEWWTLGIEGKARDDVFWRASQSGGRATQRAKFGKTTFGSYGDITAVDPVGTSLLRVFTFELKRGKSHGFIGDMIDLPLDAAIQPIEKTFEQAAKSAKDAGSVTWMVISQRDRRRCMVYSTPILSAFAPCRRFYMPRGTLHQKICYMPLSTFLRRVSPQAVADYSQQ